MWNTFEGHPVAEPMALPPPAYKLESWQDGRVLSCYYSEELGGHCQHCLSEHIGRSRDSPAVQ